MKNKSGFTLIELLVVIAIIAMLMSILVPTLSRVKDQARQIQCLNRQRQITIATNTYSSDHGVFPQNHQHGANPRNEPDYLETKTWYGLIGPYLDLQRDAYTTLSRNEGTGVLHCPTHTVSNSAPSDGSSRLDMALKMFSYAANGSVITSINNNEAPVGTVAAPSAKVMTFELHHDADWPLTYPNGTWRGAGRFVGYDAQGNRMMDYSYGALGQPGYEPTHLDKNLVYSFVDGHAEPLDHKIRLNKEFFMRSGNPGSFE